MADENLTMEDLMRRLEEMTLKLAATEAARREDARLWGEREAERVWAEASEAERLWAEREAEIANEEIRIAREAH